MVYEVGTVLRTERKVMHSSESVSQQVEVFLFHGLLMVFQPSCYAAK